MTIAKIKAFQIDTTEIADVSALNSVDTNSKIYDIAGGVDGMPVGNTTIATFRLARPISFPSNLTGSVAVANVASTGISVFSVQKNGTQFATLTFNASATGVFAGTATSFSSGDSLSIVTPASQNATLSGVFFTLSGTLV